MAYYLIILAINLCLILQTSPCFSVPTDVETTSEAFISQVIESDPMHSTISGPLDPVHAVLHGEAYFRSFIRKYGKVYRSYKEYTHRLNIFKKNLGRALHHQALDPTAIHGITPFSDLSEEEFATHFLGLHDLSVADANGTPAPMLPVGDLPASFDWREHGAVTEVKTQGLCGACWAFTTTGAIEGAHYIASGKLLNLSEQQLVDCDRKCAPESRKACDSGCKGGLMTNAYQYVMEAGGLMKADDYPYKGSVEQCKFDRDKVAVRVENFSIINSLDEDQIAANLVKHGPLAIGLNAAFMQTYVHGVSCPLLCSKHFVNHGVLLVGYQESGYAPLRFSNKPYWIIKNSWGPHWGEQGFYKLCRGLGECGMNTMVSAVGVQVSKT